MGIVTTVALAFGLCAQDDRGQEIRPLIEKLRSERIEEREQAGLQLRKLGRTAAPELEKAASDPDLELSSRARTLLRLIRLKELFGLELKDENSFKAEELVDWLEKKTGRTILYSPDLGLPNIRIRLQEALLGSGDPYVIGLNLLRMQGLAVSPLEGVPGAVELFPATMGSKRAIKVYSSAADLPRADEFCQLVVNVRYASPRDVQAALINTISFPQNCLSIESAGIVLLSDYASELRKCADLVQAMDTPRSFRISVAILEGRSGPAGEIPEPLREARLPDTIPLQSFRMLGTAAVKLDRAAKVQPPGVAPRSGHSMRFPGSPAYIVDLDGSVRAAGGPMLDRIAISLDQERPVRLFEAKVALQGEKWAFIGVVPGAEGASLILLAKAVPEAP